MVGVVAVAEAAVLMAPKVSATRSEIGSEPPGQREWTERNGRNRKRETEKDKNGDRNRQKRRQKKTKSWRK